MCLIFLLKRTDSRRNDKVPFRVTKQIDTTKFQTKLGDSKKLPFSWSIPSFSRNKQHVTSNAWSMGFLKKQEGDHLTTVSSLQVVMLYSNKEGDHGTYFWNKVLSTLVKQTRILASPTVKHQPHVLRFEQQFYSILSRAAITTCKRHHIPVLRVCKQIAKGKITINWRHSGQESHHTSFTLL